MPDENFIIRIGFAFLLLRFVVLKCGFAYGASLVLSCVSQTG